eukprot:1161816-Prymnesium_polylepis.1
MLLSARAPRWGRAVADVLQLCAHRSRARGSSSSWPLRVVLPGCRGTQRRAPSPLYPARRRGTVPPSSALLGCPSLDEELYHRLSRARHC